MPNTKSVKFPNNTNNTQPIGKSRTFNTNTSTNSISEIKNKNFHHVNPNNKENCYRIEGIIEGLQSEKTERSRIYATTNDLEKYKREEEVLALKIAEFNSLFASMTCEVYMRDELDKRSQEIRMQTEEEAQETLKEIFQDTQDTSQNTTKVATYVAIGVAVLIGGLVLIKVLKR
jgi:hypothetical protein